MKSLKHWKLEANNSFSIFFVHVNSQIEDPFAIAVHFIGFHLGRNCNRCLIEDDHFQNLSHDRSSSFDWSERKICVITVQSSQEIVGFNNLVLGRFWAAAHFRNCFRLYHHSKGVPESSRDTPSSSFSGYSLSCTSNWRQWWFSPRIIWACNSS